MIENIEVFDSLNEYCAEDIFTVRIKALAETYGFSYPFAQFYRQMSGDKCTAVFCILDHDVTVAADFDIADQIELASFFGLRGYSSLLCAEPLIQGESAKSGVVMAANGLYSSEENINIHFVSRFDELIGLFDFLEYGGAFDDWYADIKRRINKGTACACAVYDGDKIVSSALLSSIYRNAAVLSGVKTDEKYRNRGYAGALIRVLATEIGGNIYLMREQDKNEHFYNELGFKNVGEWRIYE